MAAHPKGEGGGRGGFATPCPKLEPSRTLKNTTVSILSKVVNYTESLAKKDLDNMDFSKMLKNSLKIRKIFWEASPPRPPTQKINKKVKF